MDYIRRPLDKFSKSADIDAEKINAWVQDFLRDEGGNNKLADTLLRYSDFVLGPIDYPLEKAVNNLGHTADYKFYEEEAVLNERVDRMVMSIQNGWRPHPLILTNIWEDYIEIADGGHRQRALIKTGQKIYPAILYFRNSETKENFKAFGPTG